MPGAKPCGAGFRRFRAVLITMGPSHLETHLNKRLSETKGKQLHAIGPTDLRQGRPGSLGRPPPGRCRGKPGRRLRRSSRSGQIRQRIRQRQRRRRQRSRQGQRRPPAPGQIRHRAHRGRDDGEPQLRSFPGLAAPRRRTPGRARVLRPAGDEAPDVSPDAAQRLRLQGPRPLLRGGPAPVQQRADERLPHRHGERRLRHQLLRGQGPPVHEPPRAGIHDV